MAVSGVVLLGFVITHMIGNLHLYEGPLEIHEYAETLRNLGTDIVPRTWLLWGVRLLLIVAFVVHIHSAYSLKEMGRKSKYKSELRRWEQKVCGFSGFYCRKLCKSNDALDRPDYPPLPNFSFS